MAVKQRFRLFIIVLLLAVIIDVTLSYAIGNEGNIESTSCKISSYMSGTCTVVTECGIALEALKRGRPHRLKRCGFTNDYEPNEIVCCPSTSVMIKSPDLNENKSGQLTNLRGNMKSRCQKYCEEISTESMRNVIFHIIGGDNAEEKEFPHMCALGYNIDNEINWNCGGSIITNKFILTAAHCLTKQTKPSKVRVGVTKLNDPNFQDFDIKNIVIHENYDPASKHNDIALVEIDGQIKFNEKAYPACLYYEDDEPQGLIITGWGKTSIDQEDDRTIILQKAPVVAFSRSQCNTTYSTRSMGTKDIDHTQMCAATPPGRSVRTDACWGDSGGPCQIKNKLGTFSIVGIISYGQQCGSRVPGVYTKVSQYLDWIEKHVWTK